MQSIRSKMPRKPALARQIKTSVFICFFGLPILCTLFSCTKHEDKSATAENRQDENIFLNTQFAPTTPFAEFISDNYSNIQPQFELSVSRYENTDGNYFYNNEYIALDLEEYLFDKYSECIDGVYVSILTPEEYKNMAIVLDTGRQLDVHTIIKNIAVGSGTIIIASLLLPVLAPAAAPRMAVIIADVLKDSLAGAALDAGISGVVEYVQSGKDTKSALYGALEGGADGFKWGAVISLPLRAFAETRLVHHAQKPDQTLVTFSDYSDDLSRSFSNYTDDLYRGMENIDTVDDIPEINVRTFAAGNNADNAANPSIKKLSNDPDYGHADRIPPNKIKILGYDALGNEIYQCGEHGYIYIRDKYGRILSAEAKDLKLKTHKGRLADRLPNTPGKKPADRRGHLIGDQFGGSAGTGNLVSMSEEADKAYGIIEKQLRTAKNEGKSVSLTVELKYNGTDLRPSEFHIKYTIDGESFTKVIPN